MRALGLLGEVLRGLRVSLEELFLCLLFLLLLLVVVIVVVILVLVVHLFLLFSTRGLGVRELPSEGSGSNCGGHERAQRLARTRAACALRGDARAAQREYPRLVRLIDVPLLDAVRHDESEGVHRTARRGRGEGSRHG